MGSNVRDSMDQYISLENIIESLSDSFDGMSSEDIQAAIVKLTEAKNQAMKREKEELERREREERERKEREQLELQKKHVEEELKQKVKEENNCQLCNITALITENLHWEKVIECVIGEPHISQAYNSRRNTHRNKIGSVLTCFVTGVVYDACSDSCKRNVCKHTDNVHQINVCGLYAECHCKKGVVRGKKAGSAQCYNHISTHTADRITENTFVGHVFPGSGLAPVGEYV